MFSQMRISTGLLQNRMLFPEAFKNAFLKMVEENDYSVKREKTIAQLALYHQKTIATLDNEVFFRGTPNANNSNMQNSFIRPEDEHFLIIGVTVMDGNNASVQATDWDYGANLQPVKAGQISITTNGVRVLKDMPLTEADPDLTTSDHGVITLGEPIFWGGQNDLVVEYTSPVAGAVADNLRIGLVGIGLI